MDPKNMSNKWMFFWYVPNDFFLKILWIQRYSMLQAASTAAMKLGLGPPEAPGGGKGKTWMMYG
jgi:hypothetical protein